MTSPSLREQLATAFAHYLTADDVDVDRHRDFADAALDVFREWLGSDAVKDLIAERTMAHAIDFDTTDADGNNPCSCGDWSDSSDVEGWDEHMADVATRAIADATKGDQE